VQASLVFLFYGTRVEMDSTKHKEKKEKNTGRITNKTTLKNREMVIHRSKMIRFLV